MKTNKTSKNIINVALVISFIFGLAIISQAAVMPAYNRLNPITTNINAPTSVALDAQENIYIVESINNRLLAYSQSGVYKKTFTGLDKPISVAVDANGRIFIGNKNRKNVEVYDSVFALLFKLGAGNGEFLQPNDIEIDSNGKIYVADKDGDTVKVYNADGSLNFSFGSSGSGNGQFHSPTSLEIDEASGEIIVLDHQLTIDNYGSMVDGARIQIFDMNGAYKSGFSKYGQNVGQMYKPQSIALDDEGRIYVTDTYQNVVLVYDKSGAYLGAVYSIQNPLRTPMGIILSKSNRLFVASLTTPSVEIYGIDSYTQINVTPLNLSLEAFQYLANPASQDVQIANNGTEILDWTASASDNWITLSELSGSTAISGNSVLGVGANVEGLSPNTYTGSVNISAQSGATETVTVQLTILPTPILSVDPSSMEFISVNGSSPSLQNLTVTNTGGGALNWTAVSNRNWLLLNKGTGTAPDTIEVSVSIASLTVGQYTGEITITGDNALSSPATVSVTLNVVRVTGAINISTNLTNATFIVNGPESYSGNGTSWSSQDAPVGVYSIIFGDVAGHITPSSQSQELLAGGTITFSGEYEVDRREQTSNEKYIIAGTGYGKDNSGLVKIFKADGTATGIEFLAHSYKYGVNVAAGDVNNDGIDEIITAPGPGSDNPAEIRLFDNKGNALTALGFTAYEYKYGANIASGDLNGDGRYEVIVGTSTAVGNPPYVKVFVYSPSEQKMTDSGINTLVYNTGYGLKVTTGDVDCDNVDEIITFSGKESDEATIKIWDVDPSSGAGQWRLALSREFTVSAQSDTFNIASGDIDGNGYNDLITTSFDKKERHEIKVYSSNYEIVSNFRAYMAKKYGLSVASGDLDNNGTAEIVVGAGPGSNNKAIIKVFNVNGEERTHFKAFKTKYGVNVAIGNLSLDTQ